MGSDWVHLRLCLTCGHVGCCDSSTKHFKTTRHPIIRSFEPGENWKWCWCILDVTRIESQSLHLRKQRFNLSKIISKAIEDSKNQIKQEYKKNLEIELLSTGDIIVESDRSRIYQVILNLLNNAIKFAEEDDGITITTEEKKDNNNNHIVVVSIKEGIEIIVVGTSGRIKMMSGKTIGR